MELSRPDSISSASPFAIGRALDLVCGWLALAGGLVLTAVMLVTCYSVAGRAMFGAPVLGDFELVERGVAMAVFTFLPYCHLKGGHITVDLFTAQLAERRRRWIGAVNEAAFAVVAGALTWRLSIGGRDMYLYNDASMMLQIPTWWMFVVVVASMTLLTGVCVYKFLVAVSGGKA